MKLDCFHEANVMHIVACLTPADLPKLDALFPAIRAMLEIGADREGRRHRDMTDEDLRCADLHPSGSEPPVASVEDVPFATRQDAERSSDRAPQLS